MVMSSQTLDTVVALLTIPIANKVLENTPKGEWGPAEFQKIVQSYFDLRSYFERHYFER